MTAYILKREQRVPYSLDEVFAFFSQAANLQRITPPSLNFCILTPPPLRMREGALIDYTLRIFGVPIHWRTLITTYDPPHRFVDEQIKGPYVFWHHTHTFREDDDGTIIGDEVRYVLPFGALGRLMHAVYVRRDLERIFDYREEVIAQVFAAQ
ncbi:MAG: SRPBCC family protein [Candidatus Hydrogenedentes bacterium]|nr:SRPBCC family protein [Candidatus Hydrogenedentota bacterium]